MNVFALDLDPRAAARMHCDRHVVKMPTETAQLLSSALHLHGVHDERLYRPTHLRHPCTVWTAATRANFAWLVELGRALVDEHGRRYSHTKAGKRGHAARAVIDVAAEFVHRLPSGALTEHAQAMPHALQQPAQPVKAYRAYYLAEKRHLAAWRAPATPPAWWS